MILDALGNEIVVGGWYGYSRNDGGFSHTVIGLAGRATEGDPDNYQPPKVRLTQCRVKRYLYGRPSDHRAGEKSKDISMAAFMLFPVPSPTD